MSARKTNSNQLGDNYRDKYKQQTDTDTIIEIYGDYDFEIKLYKTPTNPIIIETTQFDGLEEDDNGDSTAIWTELQAISTASTTTITTTETQNYIRVSSGGLEVGTDVAIQLIVKKKK